MLTSETKGGGGGGGKEKRVAECDPSIKKAYIWRVYLILLLQLFLIDVSILWSTSTRAFLNGSESHPVVIGVFAALVLVIWIIMFCGSSTIAKVWPFNAVLLVIFTLASSFLLMTLANEYHSPFIADTVVLVSFVLLLQMLYAMLPCCGYSWIISILISLLGILAVALIILLPNPDSFTLRWQVDWKWITDQKNLARDQALSSVATWISIVIALIFSWIFQYTLWQITHQLEPGQHVQGAFELYVTMLMTFAFAIQAVGTLFAKIPSTLRSMIPLRSF
jgi:FtsH-binding integral membrane protein